MPDSEKKKLNIYLDNCCYNRPYDDQTQLRIELETKAKLFIQTLIEEDTVDLTISYMSELENSDSPFEDRKMSIAKFFDNAKATVTETTDIVERAEKFVENGLKSHDSLHLSCAIAGGCDYFLSTDDRLLKHKDDRIKSINPVDFIRLWRNNDDDE
jgi:predicted nucleic acid-binding protein